MKKGCAIVLILAACIAAAAFFFGPQLVETGLRFLYPKPYGELVAREAAEFGLEEHLVYAVIKTESGFDEDAESHADAHGLMQLTQPTFDWMAELHPPENGGRGHLRPRGQHPLRVRPAPAAAGPLRPSGGGPGRLQRGHGQRGRLAPGQRLLPGWGDPAHHPLPGDRRLRGESPAGLPHLPTAVPRRRNRLIFPCLPWYSKTGQTNRAYPLSSIGGIHYAKKTQDREDRRQGAGEKAPHRQDPRRCQGRRQRAGEGR